MSATAELQEERAKLGLGPNGERPPEMDDEERQEELFPVGSLDGDGIDLKHLIKPGKPVEYTKSLLKGEVPGRNGLTNPEGTRRAIVTHEVAEVVIVIKREDGEITGYKIREKLRPTYVEQEAN